RHRSIPFSRYELRIFLMRPLPLQEVVVPAVRLVGVLVADAGARVVDRAAPRVGVEEHADAAEEFVLLMAQDLFAFDSFREASCGCFVIDVEVARQPREIGFFDDDPVITAAVGWALRTIVLELRRHDRSVLASPWLRKNE